MSKYADPRGEGEISTCGYGSMRNFQATQKYQCSFTEIKSISSFHIVTTVHELRILKNDANLGQDSLERTLKIFLTTQNAILIKR